MNLQDNHMEFLTFSERLFIFSTSDPECSKGEGRKVNVGESAKCRSCFSLTASARFLRSVTLFADYFFVREITESRALRIHCLEKKLCWDMISTDV